MLRRTEKHVGPLKTELAFFFVTRSALSEDKRSMDLGKTSGKTICVEPSPSALNTFAAKRGLQACQLSIDICCRRPRSAANPPADAAAVDRWDRQTDGRTPDRYIDLAPRTMRRRQLAGEISHA